MKEQIVTGKKFRILTDVTSRLWHVISFWTKAQDIEFNDGTNAQAKLGNIAGISDSLTSTASNVAASAKAVKILNDKVVNQIGNLNGQINQKNQTINDLNRQIANLNQQLENSIKQENIVNYIKMNYRGSNPVTLTKKSMVSIRGSRAITNHDNSTKGYIAIGVEKNGSLLVMEKDFVDEFGGGTCSIAYDGIGNAGDNFAVVFKDLNDSGNATWENPTPEWSSGLSSHHTRDVSDIVVVGSL